MNPTKEQIKALITEAKGFSALIGNWAAYQEAEKKFWAKIGLLTDGQRLEPGSLLQFSVADGYAFYIVTEVKRAQVVVAHLPIGDAYSFQGCYLNAKGETLLPRPVAEKSFQMAQALKEIFSS